MIALNRVTRRFREGSRERLILDNLQFAADAGEFVSITGPSGSGKSSLLNIIGAIDYADSGEVIVADQRVDLLSEHQRALYRRQHVGFVFQFFNLIPTLTVSENLQLPLALAAKPVTTTLIPEWLQRVGLADRASAYPDVLSGGEQQRVAIVRAVIHEPTVVLADEPTGNLDQKTGADILALLGSLVLRGTTIIMATHSQEAADAASRKMTLENGALRMADGS